MSSFRSYGRDEMPPVVKTLIIINAVVFLAQLLLNSRYSITYYLALHPLDSPFFSSYQMITHMFTHGGWFHIFFNMFSLFMFGTRLENVWGGKRFIAFYLMCGVGAAVLHLLVQHFGGNGALAVGASGAVMGIFAAFAMLFPTERIVFLFIPIPMQAKYAMLLFMAIDLFGGIAGKDNIAHFAHLGGAITGIIMVWIWNKNRSQFY